MLTDYLSNHCDVAYILVINSLFPNCCVRVCDATQAVQLETALSGLPRSLTGQPNRKVWDKKRHTQLNSQVLFVRCLYVKYYYGMSQREIYSFSMPMVALPRLEGNAIPIAEKYPIGYQYFPRFAANII